jgi:hypothetical protein
MRSINGYSRKYGGIPESRHEMRSAAYASVMSGSGLTLPETPTARYVRLRLEPGHVVQGLSELAVWPDP